MPATLTLPQGATSATLQISITADTDVEGAENFDIELVAVEDAPYELGAPATATITINDDDRATLDLGQSVFTVNEADGALDITVNIAPTLPVTSTVNITTEHLSSTAADITVPATLTLPAGAASATSASPSPLIPISRTPSSSWSRCHPFQPRLTNWVSPMQPSSTSSTTPPHPLLRPIDIFHRREGAADLTLNVSRPPQSAQTVPLTLLWTWPGTSGSQTTYFTLPQGATSANSNPLRSTSDYDSHQIRTITLVAGDGALYRVGDPPQPPSQSLTSTAPPSSPLPVRTIRRRNRRRWRAQHQREYLPASDER